MIKNRLLYSKDNSLEELLTLLDANGNGFLPIVDKEDHLLGVVTDGDIRKAFLRKKYEVDDIINKNPITMSESASNAEIINELKKIYRRQMPIVDVDNKLVDIIEFDNLDFNIKENRVVIMAGGLGSRLGSLTKHTPKPMLSVGAKPMLEHLIEKFSSYGFLNFYLSVNYKADVIKNYFQDGRKWGVSINYLEEDKPLGTAGALSMLEREALEEPFFVINGDILTNLDFSKLLRFHQEHDSHATMCTRTYEMQVPYGVVNTKENAIISMQEKPIQSYNINAGIYVLNPKVLKYIPQNSFFDMPSLYELLIEQRFNVNSYTIDDYWIDIGQVHDYEQANRDIEA